MTWKSKLPDPELGWSQEMDTIYHSLILSRDYYKKTKFMGKIGGSEKRGSENSQTAQNTTIKRKSKKMTFAFKILLLQIYITGRLVTFNQSRRPQHSHIFTNLLNSEREKSKMM